MAVVALSGWSRRRTLRSSPHSGLAAEAGSSAATLALRLARANATVAVPFATEAGHFQAAGVSTIVCGPGSIVQAHKPDEYVETEQLALCLGFLHRLHSDA